MDKSFKHVSSKSINEGLDVSGVFVGYKLETELKGGMCPGAPVLPMPMHHLY